MPSTGNTFPGTGENIDRAGSNAWTTPGNITADDAADATLNAAGSDYLVARNFGFSIPAGATIDGITVRVEASEHSGGTESLNARLQDDGAALVGSSKANTLNGTAKAVYTYGDAADVWGASLTSTIVNDPDFGVRLWYTTSHDVRIDFVTLAVDYTEPTRRGQIGWAELEVPNAPRRAQISWGELEVPTAPRRGQVGWAEFEVPDSTQRRGVVTFAEIEVPNAPRRGQIGWAELEAPNAPRRGIVGFAELEAPNGPRRGIIGFAELEIPDVGAPPAPSTIPDVGMLRDVGKMMNRS